MTSILKVSEIQDPTNSNTALTIGSSGDVTISETVIDSWRLTANFTTNAATITGWERPDDGFHAYINGLTESSGVFSFTKNRLVYNRYCSIWTKCNNRRWQLWCGTSS